MYALCKQTRTLARRALTWTVWRTIGVHTDVQPQLWTIFVCNFRFTSALPIRGELHHKCQFQAPNPIYFNSILLNAQSQSCVFHTVDVWRKSREWNEPNIEYAQDFSTRQRLWWGPLVPIWIHSAIFFSCLHRANYMRQRSTQILHEMTRKHQQSSSSHARTHCHTHTHHSIVFVFALYRCKIANCIMQKQNTYQNETSVQRTEVSFPYKNVCSLNRSFKLVSILCSYFCIHVFRNPYVRYVYFIFGSNGIHSEKRRTVDA